jgi:uncharacterized protein (TIGR02001 family)
MIFLFCFLSQAMAQISGEAVLTSNFLWRGTTFSENRPAIQGTLEYDLPYEHGLGIFVSNAEFTDEAMGSNTSVTHEVDVFFHKVVTFKNWSIDFNYSYFTFGEAHFYNTDEWNLKFFVYKWMLELSYMDDFFGYQSTYKYIRAGREIAISKNEALSFFWGYNSFSNRKGKGVSRCLDQSCVESAYSTNGAGNTDYNDWYVSYQRSLDDQTVIELGYNFTDRFEYEYDGAEVTKSDAKDNVFLMTLTYQL